MLGSEGGGGWGAGVLGLRQEGVETQTSGSEGGVGQLAWTLLNWDGLQTGSGTAGKLLSHRVSLPTRKACSCCPLVDMGIRPAEGQGADRSRNPRKGRQRDRPKWEQRQRDRN